MLRIIDGISYVGAQTECSVIPPPGQFGVARMILHHINVLFITTDTPDRWNGACDGGFLPPGAQTEWSVTP